MQDRPEIHRAIAALQRLSELFALRRRQLAREAELSVEQWRLLEEIAGEAFMPSLFAKRRACTAAAVSRGLRALQERGLVSASISEADGRQRIYRLTPEGRRLLRRLRTARERAIAAVWERFDTPALRGFVDFADELADHLEEYARERQERAPTSRGSAASASR
jgi:DNA-binding MarR family transcriptional regulator